MAAELLQHFLRIFSILYRFWLVRLVLLRYITAIPTVNEMRLSPNPTPVTSPKEKWQGKSSSQLY